MTNLIEQATQTIVKFKEKSVYGGTLIYPNNEPDRKSVV